ncbi:MAG: hypothetical protein RIQ62_1577 [Bacteroidota bacterium]|jgi:predicted DNA binding CopG/RHH family protein
MSTKHIGQKIRRAIKTVDGIDDNLLQELKKVGITRWPKKNAVKEKKKRKTLQIRISEEIHSMVRREAKNNRITMSRLLDKICEKALGEVEVLERAIARNPNINQNIERIVQEFNQKL